MKQAGATWPIAIGSDGNYVHIQDARRGGLYKCPQCSAHFVARLGSIKAWHFAHYPGATCTGEGARHDMTKHMIASALPEIRQLPLYCRCLSLPTKPFNVKFTDIHVEEAVDDYRIDVGCRVNGRQLCVEVVDSNPVSDDKRQVLQNRLVEVNISKLSTEEVFKGLQTRSLLEKQLSRALEGMVRKHEYIHTWIAPCWKCGRPRRVAMMCGIGWSESLPPEVLTAMRKYATIEFRRTSVVPRGYMANVCPHCNTVQGEWYLDEERMGFTDDPDKSGMETIFVPLDV